MSDKDSTFSAQVNKLATADDENAHTDGTPISDLVAVVDDLLNQLTLKFSSVSSDMIARMDDMSRRLDALEANMQAADVHAADDASQASGP